MSRPCLIFLMTRHQDKLRLPVHSAAWESARLSPSAAAARPPPCWAPGQQEDTVLDTFLLWTQRVGGCGQRWFISLTRHLPDKAACTGLRGAPTCQKGARTCDSFDCPHKCLCVFASTLCAPMSAARRVLRAIKLSDGPTRDGDLSRLARRGSGSAEGRGTLTRPCAVRGYYYREDGAEQWRQETDDGGE